MLLEATAHILVNWYTEILIHIDTVKLSELIYERFSGNILCVCVCVFFFVT